MNEQKITREEIEALLKLADAATPGPWECGDTQNEGAYGSGPDCRERFTSYTVEANGKIIADTLNSDVATVEEEYDEDGTTAWDEVGRRNMKFIATANPVILKTLCTMALKWLDAQPRPIEEASKDGTWLLFFGRNSVQQRMIPVVIAWSPPGLGEGWRDSAQGAVMDNLVATGGDFIPLISLPEPRK